MNFDQWIHKINNSKTYCEECGSLVEIKGMKDGKDTSLHMVPLGYKDNKSVYKGLCISCYRKWYNVQRSPLSIKWRKDFGQI